MANVVGGGKHRILVDEDGDAVTVNSNRLDVNAYLAATPTIDIGDVSLLLGGTAASVNNGAADATTLRVTIASDTTGVLSVDDNGSTLSIDDGGGAITVDGTVTANLSATDNTALDLVGANTGLIKTATQSLATAVYVDDADWTDGSSTHLLVGGLYQSSPQSVTDGDVAPFAMSSTGELHVEMAVGSVWQTYAAAHDVDLGAIATSTGAVESYWGLTTRASGGQFSEGQYGFGMFGVRNDTLATLCSDDNDYTPLQVNASGALYVAGTVDLGSTDNAVLDAMAASLALLDNAIASGNELQVDVVAALPAGTNAIGKLAANSGVDIGDVDVTSTVQPAGFASIGHGSNTDVGTSAEVLTTSTACKHVDIMAAVGNTGIIVVGGSGVNISSGISLYAGDVYSVDIDDLNDIYVMASVNGENVSWTYYN